MPLPLSRSAVICLKHRRGGSPDPPAGFGTGFIPRGGFRPLGEFLSQRWERNQRIAGGDSHRRRKQVPSGSSSFSPSPPFTGDTPIPFRKISGAQNMVPGMIPPGPLGPGVVQNFGLCHFTAAPGSDQPRQRVRDRRCAGRGRSENRREGQAPPLRNDRKSDPQQKTGGPVSHLYGVFNSPVWFRRDRRGFMAAVAIASPRTEIAP